jgi:hypothetical protein
MVFRRIDYNASTSPLFVVSIIGNSYIFEFSLRQDICVRLCLHFVLTRIYIIVRLCVILVHVYTYVYTWRDTIFFYI